MDKADLAAWTKAEAARLRKVEARKGLASDTELLDAMQRATTQGNVWVCRQSTTDRGMRVHETTLREAKAYHWQSYRTVREAIAAMATQ